MRTFTDNLIFALVAVLICGLAWVGYGYSQEADKLTDTQEIISSIREKAVYYGALEFKNKNPNEDKNKAVYAKQPSVEWFDGNPKLNPYAPSNIPWIDVAEAKSVAEHPYDPVLYSSEQAGFWYNPTNGIVRARVLPQISEQETLELYNKVNGTTMRDLPIASKNKNADTGLAKDDEGKD